VPGPTERRPLAGDGTIRPVKGLESVRIGRLHRPVLAIALAILIFAPVRLGGQQPTFRSETELVNLGVTVVDKRGNFISDLAQEDFEIVEDGRKQSIRLFARGDADVAPELHVGLLLDTSGSMGEDIGLARSAAVKFLNTLSEARDMTLVDFDTEVRVAKYGQQDFPRMVERIRSRKPDGYTAMYDALGVYLDGASEDDGRTILVLFTDGGDTRSTMTFNDALTLLRASDVTVYTIGFLEHQSGSVRFDQRTRLSQIADETGGQAFFPLSMKEITDAYDRILAQIRAQYSLGYLSTNTAQDGRWRKVEIRVRRPDLKDTRIRSRKGYFAPFKR
jgi:Ca-activated chloride channel family protein